MTSAVPTDEIYERYLRKAIGEINELQAELLALADETHVPVLGSGHPLGDVFLLKHAPEPAEIAEGVAFFGRAGNALLKSLQRLAVDPLAIYGTNCLKFGTEDDEQATPWLTREIHIVQPKLIVVMGSEAVSFLDELAFPLADPTRRPRARGRPPVHADDRGHRDAGYRRRTRRPGREDGVLERLQGTGTVVGAAAAVLELMRMRSVTGVVLHQGACSTRRSSRLVALMTFSRGDRSVQGRMQRAPDAHQALPRRAAALAAVLVLLVAWSAGAGVLPELSLWPDVLLLSLVVLPVTFLVPWLALPLSQIRIALPLAGCFAVLALVGYLAGIDSLFNVAKLLTLTMIGYVFMQVFEALSWVVLIALIIPWVDAWSVWRGPTGYVVSNKPGLIERISIGFRSPARTGSQASARRTSSSSRCFSPPRTVSTSGSPGPGSRWSGCWP